MLGVQTTGGFEQAPVWVSQVPVTWQRSLGEQTTVGPATHRPLPHVSPTVHALPSLHWVPFSAFGREHTPVPGSQVPATWH